jgi:hypothetical protein
MKRQTIKKRHNFYKSGINFQKLYNKKINFNKLKMKKLW